MAAVQRNVLVLRFHPRGEYHSGTENDEEYYYPQSVVNPLGMGRPGTVHHDARPSEPRVTTYVKKGPSRALISEQSYMLRTWVCSVKLRPALGTALRTPSHQHLFGRRNILATFVPNNFTGYSIARGGHVDWFKLRAQVPLKRLAAPPKEMTSLRYGTVAFALP